MENRISRGLHYHYIDVLQEKWLLWKIGLYNRYWEDSITTEIYFLDRWTRHMTVPPLRTESLKFYWVYLKNSIIVSRLTIYKQKRKKICFSSISSCLLLFFPTSPNMMARCLKSSTMKYKEDMKSSNSSRPN